MPLFLNIASLAKDDKKVEVDHLLMAVPEMRESGHDPLLAQTSFREARSDTEGSAVCELIA